MLPLHIIKLILRAAPHRAIARTRIAWRRSTIDVCRILTIALRGLVRIRGNGAWRGTVNWRKTASCKRATTQIDLSNGIITRNDRCQTATRWPPRLRKCRPLKFAANARLHELSRLLTKRSEHKSKLGCCRKFCISRFMLAVSSPSCRSRVDSGVLERRSSVVSLRYACTESCAICVMRFAERETNASSRHFAGFRFRPHSVTLSPVDAAGQEAQDTQDDFLEIPSTRLKTRIVFIPVYRCAKNSSQKAATGYVNKCDGRHAN